MPTKTTTQGKIKKVKIKDGYETSRVMYWLEAAFAYFIEILSGGAFLAKLTSEVGISDSVTAILTALTSLAGLSQMVSIYIAGRARSVKKPVTAMLLVAQILYASLYLIPFLNIGKVGMSALFFMALLSARVLTVLPAPLKLTWFMNLVPIEKRGMYTAIVQIISFASGAAVSFIAGVIIDNFEAAGNIEGAFITLTIVIFACAALHLITLLSSKEKTREITKKRSLASSIKTLMKNKKYRILLIVLILETLGNNVILPFLGTYQTKELGFTMTFISVIGIVFSCVSMAGNMFFGRLSQEVRHKTILRFSYPIVMFAYIVNIFTSPANGAVLFIIYSIILRIGNAATAVSQSNLILEITPQEEQTAAISVFTIASGIGSFLITLAVSPFVDYMQGRGNELFGRTIYAQQLLSALCVLFYLVAILIYYFAFIPEIDGKKTKKEKTSSV